MPNDFSEAIASNRGNELGSEFSQASLLRKELSRLSTHEMDQAAHAKGATLTVNTHGGEKLGPICSIRDCDANFESPDEDYHNEDGMRKSLEPPCVKPLVGESVEHSQFRLSSQV